MSTLAHWNPFRELEDVHRRFYNLFGAGARPVSGNEKEALAVAEWSPLVDITEDDKEYVISAEVPDIQKDGIKVTVENGVLVISGERKFEKEEKDKKYHRIERSYGKFTRSFTLPDDVDPAKVEAQFKDGVLKVHVAKSETAQPKQIEVKVS